MLRRSASGGLLAVGTPGSERTVQLVRPERSIGALEFDVPSVSPLGRPRGRALCAANLRCRARPPPAFFRCDRQVGGR